MAPLPEPFAQTSGLRFDDPATETAYQQDRAQRDADRANRVQIAVAIVVILLGVIITTGSLLRHNPVSTLWIILRFGLVVPALLTSSLLVTRPWGRRHLQALLAAGVALMAGAQSLGWFTEWVPGLSLRSLWIVPVTTLWAATITLPLGPRAVIGATVGTLAIAQTAIIVVVPSIDLTAALSTAIAFALCGYVLVLFARWRESDHRELFIHRRRTEQLAEKLSAQNRALVQLNRQRDELVASMLHDLRSPVTGVLLIAETLRSQAALPPAARDRLLGDMTGAARRIDQFASHFLEQRSLERAAHDLRLVPVPLAAAVHDAVERARLAASRKQQQLQIQLAAAELAVIADELLLDRAIGNLLDNAVKFSPLGVTITVHTAVDPTASDRVRILVTDPGPGLTADDQARLFQPYTRLGPRSTAGEPSTGLGLSLVKQWVEAMGGAVGCESEPRHGSTFWIAVRRAPAVV